MKNKNTDKVSTKKISLPNKKLFLFLVIFIIGLSAYFNFNLYQSQKQQKVNMLCLAAENIRQVMVEDAGYVEYQMRYISNQIRQKGHDPKTIAKILSTFDMDKNINIAVSWNMFSFVDLTKHLSIDAEGGILKDPRDMSNRDYLPYTIKNPGNLYLGKPVFGAYSNQWMIPGGLGVVDKNGKYIGTIVWGFVIDSLDKKLKSVIAELEGMDFAIASKENGVITKSNSENKKEHQSTVRFLKNKKSDDSELVFDKNGGYFCYKNIRNLSEIHYFINLNLYIVTFYNESARYKQELLLLLPRIAEFMVILIFLAALFLVVKLKLIKPINTISQITEDIINDKKIVKFNSKNPNEIEEIFKKLELIDEYKNMAREANIQKSSFLSSVSHELRSPIISIKGIADILIENYKELSEENRKDFLQNIKDCSEESLEFIGDLLDVGQSESGNFQLKNVKEHDLSDLIRRSIKIVEGRAVRSSIKIDTKIAENIPQLKCDERRIKQILVNLLTNSIKYSSKNTLIEIILRKTAKGKQNIELIIKDQGFGMSEVDIKKAMQKYQVIENENSGKIDSLGLGLPLVKHLIEQHEGEFKIKSEIGKGSEFIIQF